MERELWTLLYAVATKLDKPWGAWKYSASDILVVYVWAVLHDRPMCWGVQKGNWPEDLCPACLPSQSTLSRRMRNDAVRQLMTAVEETWLALLGASTMWVCMIDGKPCGVSNVSKDRDARFGRGAGGLQNGYKFHAVWADGPLPLAWALTPMNVSEKQMARQLIPSLRGSGYLLGDPEYDCNDLYDLAHAADHQLLAPKRQKHRGIGHRRQSPYRLRSIALMKQKFGKGLYRYRRQIERQFGNLTSFGGGLTCLPPWVRRFPRVRNWLNTKLLINAARWFRGHPAVNALA
jgi:Transposase DDE domain